MQNERIPLGAIFLSIIAICTAVVVGTNNIKSSTELNLLSDELWTIAGRLDHVHFIVGNLDEAMNSYKELLGLTPDGKGGYRRDFPDGRIAMLPLRGARIKMIESNPLTMNRMSRFLKEHGEGVAGFSIFVEDFDKEVELLKNRGVTVEVTTTSAIDPKYPFRLGWIEAEQCHGAWLEIVDAKAVPPYEKDWNSGGQPNTSKKFDHVHFIVSNLDEALKSYEKLMGLTPTGKGGFRRDFEGGRLGMLPLHGARIEMVEPSAQNFRMFNFLKKRGEGLGGLSIFVEDFDKEIKTLREKGVTVEVMTTPVLDPKYPLRLGWVEADEAHGVWLEIVDATTVPPFDLDWESALITPDRLLLDKSLALPSHSSKISGLFNTVQDLRERR